MQPKLAVLGLLLAVASASSAKAQATIDVSKITCDQYVHSKISTPNYIAAWLSGYYNAKRNNRLIDTQALQDNVSKLQNYCYEEKNFKVPVMKAIEEVFGKKKG
jgi:acid stress chaperone HdeB